MRLYTKQLMVFWKYFVSYKVKGNWKWKSSFISSYKVSLDTFQSPVFIFLVLISICWVSYHLKRIYLIIILQIWGLTLDAYCLWYPHTVPFSIFFSIFTIQKSFHAVCKLFSGFHFRIALNLPKYALFNSYPTHTVPFWKVP